MSQYIYVLCTSLNISMFDVQVSIYLCMVNSYQYIYVWWTAINIYIYVVHKSQYNLYVVHESQYIYIWCTSLNISIHKKKPACYNNDNIIISQPEQGEHLLHRFVLRRSLTSYFGISCESSGPIVTKITHWWSISFPLQRTELWNNAYSWWCCKTILGTFIVWPSIWK